MSNQDSFSTANTTNVTQAAAPAAPLTASEERTWAMLAHLASVLSIFTFWLLGPVAAGVIWLVYRDRSKYVSGQALQSTLFQVAALFVNAFVWGTTVALMPFLVGFCLIPAAMLVSLGLILYPLYGAYACSQGRPFRYFIIGDVVAGLHS